MGDVVNLDVVTRLDVPAARILEAASGAGLSSVVVIGLDDDGDFYFASSSPDAADVSWLCLRAIHRLQRIIDQAEGG